MKSITYFFCIGFYACCVKYPQQLAPQQKNVSVEYISILPDTLSLNIKEMKEIKFKIKNGTEHDIEILEPYKANFEEHYSEYSSGRYKIKDSVCNYLSDPTPGSIDRGLRNVLLRKGDSIIVTLDNYPSICLLGHPGQYELNYVFNYKINGVVSKSQAGWRKLYMKED